VRYVALGDSYTIGTSVLPAERWPERLAVAIGPDEPMLELVANLGVNGYTSGDLVRAELPALEGLEVGLVGRGRHALDHVVDADEDADHLRLRRQRAAIVAANATMARRCHQAGIAYVDIFDLSLRAAVDRSLGADAGLHPSALQYGLWVERIAPVVTGLIGRRPVDHHRRRGVAS
jgi:lysophospholipase L1-like esterase